MPQVIAIIKSVIAVTGSLSSNDPMNTVGFIIESEFSSMISSKFLS